MRWVIVLAPVVAALVATIFLAMPFERTHAVFFESFGYTESETKFGVRIGMDANEAAEVLVASGLDPMPDAAMYALMECRGRRPEQLETLKLYFDDSWRDGSVCFVVRNSKVVAIGWVFSPLTP
jgi:hypothetical protein